MVIGGGGDVGIGTTSPSQKLHSRTSGGNELQYALELQNPNGESGGGTATGVLFSTEADANYGKGALVYERNSSWAKGTFHFLQNSTDDSSNPALNNAVMSIANNGYVGIGTTGPDGKLEVYGGQSLVTNNSITGEIDGRQNSYL